MCSSFLFTAIICTVLILLVACVIVFERKKLAATQPPIGPAIFGRRGLLQTIVNAFKPLLKDKSAQNAKWASTVWMFSIIYLLHLVVCSAMFSGIVESTTVASGECVIVVSVISSCTCCAFIIYFGYFAHVKHSIMGRVRAVMMESFGDVIILVIFSLIFCYCSNMLGNLSLIILLILLFIFIIIVIVFIILFYTFVISQKEPVERNEYEGERVAGYNLESDVVDLLVTLFEEYLCLFNGGRRYFAACGILLFSLYATIYPSNIFNVAIMCGACLPASQAFFILFLLLLWYRFVEHLACAQTEDNSIRRNVKLGVLIGALTNLTLVAAKIFLIITSVTKLALGDILMGAVDQPSIVAALVGFLSLMCKHKLHKWALDPENFTILCELNSVAQERLFLYIECACSMTLPSVLYCGTVLHITQLLLDLANSPLPALETHPFFAKLQYLHVGVKAW